MNLRKFSFQMVGIISCEFLKPLEMLMNSDCDGSNSD